MFLIILTNSFLGLKQLQLKLPVHQEKLGVTKENLKIEPKQT